MNIKLTDFQKEKISGLRVMQYLMNIKPNYGGYFNFVSLRVMQYLMNIKPGFIDGGGRYRLRVMQYLMNIKQSESLY